MGKENQHERPAEKDVETVKNAVQTDFDTPLNPRFSAGVDVDITNPSSASAFYEGDSIDAHRQIEEANMYIADKELGQQRDNL